MAAAAAGSQQQQRPAADAETEAEAADGAATRVPPTGIVRRALILCPLSFEARSLCPTAAAAFPDDELNVPPP